MGKSKYRYKCLTAPRGEGKCRWTLSHFLGSVAGSFTWEKRGITNESLGLIPPKHLFGPELLDGKPNPVHTYNRSAQEVEARGGCHKFEINLGYIAILHLINTKYISLNHVDPEPSSTS